MKLHSKPATAKFMQQWRVFLSMYPFFAILILAFSSDCWAAVPPNSPALRTNASHVLGVGDLVEVKVYKEDDLLTKTKIDRDGTVYLPLIHTVPVAGKTIAEARDVIRSLYEKEYLVSADVSITLLEFAPTNKVEKPKLKFTVAGEVKKPGLIEIPEGDKVDLVNAIALAGDFTTLANKRKVTVKRREGEGVKVYEIDVQSMLRDAKAKPFEVKPGDFIEVRQTLF